MNTCQSQKGGMRLQVLSLNCSLRLSVAGMQTSACCPRFQAQSETSYDFDSKTG